MQGQGSHRGHGVKAQWGAGSYGGKQPKLCLVVLSWIHSVRECLREKEVKVVSRTDTKKKKTKPHHHKKPNQQSLKNSSSATMVYTLPLQYLCYSSILQQPLHPSHSARLLVMCHGSATGPHRNGTRQCPCWPPTFSFWALLPDWSGSAVIGGERYTNVWVSCCSTGGKSYLRAAWVPALTEDCQVDNNWCWKHLQTGNIHVQRSYREHCSD